jgi:hypothetical protein
MFATSWPNTETGELVYLGKHRYKIDGDRQTRIGRLLMKKVVAVIQAHPLLRKADIEDYAKPQLFLAGG